MFAASLVLAAGQVTSAHAAQISQEALPRPASQTFPTSEQPRKEQFIQVNLLDKDDKVTTRLLLGVGGTVPGSRLSQVNFFADRFDEVVGEGNYPTSRRMRGNVVIKAKINGVDATLLKIDDPNVTVEYVYHRTGETPKAKPAPPEKSKTP